MTEQDSQMDASMRVGGPSDGAQASGRLAIGPCQRSAEAPWIPSTASDVLVVPPPGTDVEAVAGGVWCWIGGVGCIFHDLVRPTPSAEWAGHDQIVATFPLCN